MAKARCPCCTDEGKLACSGCKDIKYCSRECQEADWQFHKHLCKSLKDFTTPPQPGMFRAVLFPHHGKKPEFVWMNAEPEGPEGRSMGTRQCFRNEHTGAHLSGEITVYYDGHTMYHSKYANSALHIATNGKNAFKWAGPIFALKSRSFGSPGSGTFGDMDMTSYSDLMAYLIQFWNPSATVKRYKAPKVRGVKMYCDGEREANKGLPRAVSVKVPRIHPIFDGEGRVSDVSRMIDMPLVIRKYAVSLNEIKRGGLCIPAVTFMQIGCDPSKRYENPTGEVANFGWAPLDWTGGHVPNVFISQMQDEHGRAYDQDEYYEEEDGEASLQVSTVEAFADFCEHHLTNYFQWDGEQEDVYVEDDNDGDGIDEDGIDQVKRALYDKVVMDQMTPETWERYLMQWHAHRAKKTAKAADISARCKEGDGDSGLEDLVDRLAHTGVSDGDDGETLMGVSARQGEVLIRSLLGMPPATEEQLARYED